MFFNLKGPRSDEEHFAKLIYRVIYVETKLNLEWELWLCMWYLSDHALIDAYKKALEMELEEEFIELLTNELYSRKIVPGNEIAGDRKVDSVEVY